MQFVVYHLCGCRADTGPKEAKVSEEAEMPTKCKQACNEEVDAACREAPRGPGIGI